MTNFRVFGPDETASNKLDGIYKASGKTWMEEMKPEDADGGFLSTDGRVMEMLSEHTLEGWFEGYVLTGRHGFFSIYEAFVHIIDSMFNQHAKWLEKTKLELRWRAPISSINLLITSLVWRQDHNGFTHQDPGFLDVVTNKSPEVVRIYLPPDANCLLSVADHCLRSTDYVNVIVADKAEHLQYLTMEQAVDHCTKGIGIWDFASNDDGAEPDAVMACAGDIPTSEALAAVAILRERCPEVKIRFVNVVDLFRLMPEEEHPHGLSTRSSTAVYEGQAGDLQLPCVCFADSQADVPAHEPRQHPRARVQGEGQHQYAAGAGDPEPGGPVQPGDRCDRPRAEAAGDGGAYEGMAEGPDHRRVNYAHENGIDRPEIRGWKWPF